jgi:hypothetical protein
MTIDAQALNRWANKATVIRCSSLTGYPDCPRRGATRLFWREIVAAGFRLRSVRRGIGAAVGTAVHAAAAVVFGEKAKTGELPPESVALDATVSSLNRAIGDGPIEYDGPTGSTHNLAQAEAQSLRMTRAYFRVVAPTVCPIHVEERLEAEVAPGLVLSGQPDIVAREPRAVRDLKTGARMGSHAPQIGGYSLLARSHALDIDSAAIDWVQRAAVGKPQADPVSVAVKVAEAETAASNIIRHIEADLRTFREGDAARRIRPGDPWAFLANPASMLCSPKYCAAHGTEFCHEGKEPQP